MVYSIIIPVFNCEKYIVRCIDSIKAQTFSDFECILIDDGSTDNSKSLITESIKNDSRFSFYQNEKKGVSSARNFGLSKSLGKYLLFIDSDDWIIPDMLLTLLSKGQNSDVIQFDFYKASNIGERTVKKEIHINSNINLILQGEGATVWKRAFKRSFISGITFDESLKGGEDYLFCSEVFLKNPDFLYLHKCLYNYNVSNIDSAMNKNSLDLFIDQLLATKKVITLLKESDSYDVYKNDINERIFWCLSEFNNYWLSLKIRKPLFRKIILKLIKILLKL